jgi:hypothetical protein
MLRVTAALICVSLFCIPACLAQTSSDGFFSVRHLKKPSFTLNTAQMREAEKLYQSACQVVQRDFHGGDLHPRFTVMLGAERNAVYGQDQIWLKQWNPVMFTQGVVVLAFDQVLTGDVTKQLAKRAFEQVNASVDVRDLRTGH